jgi:hypothetical protein
MAREKRIDHIIHTHLLWDDERIIDDFNHLGSCRERSKGIKCEKMRMKGATLFTFSSSYRSFSIIHQYLTIKGQQQQHKAPPGGDDRRATIACLTMSDERVKKGEGAVSLKELLLVLDSRHRCELIHGSKLQTDFDWYERRLIPAGLSDSFASSRC